MIEPTLFATAERQTHESIEHDRALLAEIPHLTEILNALPIYVLILNADRQIVFANSPFKTFLAADEAGLLGHRPGEALRCMHAYERITGCGTTEFCRECGAVAAILASHEKRPEVRECRILLENLDALDLRVWAVPLTLGGGSFTFFSITDISAEKRKGALERTCFHDINNLLGILSLCSETVVDQLKDSAEGGPLADMLGQTVGRLVDEVRAGQAFIQAESRELRVNLAPQPCAEVLRTVCGAFRSAGVDVALMDDSGDEQLVTDRVLLGRIITNMIKNAHEADGSGSPIEARCSLVGGFVRYAVHNSGVMPEEVQHQVFQRSFSTKGPNRGLGTYGMKLIGERYLGGRVWFESATGAGTTFYLELPEA